MRDLLGIVASVHELERKKVACEGWVARLLTYPDASSRWEGQVYCNKWRSTTSTLLLIRQMGL